VWARNICFGHVPIAVRKVRQRRDAAAAGEEQFGRFAAGQNNYYRLYLYSGKETLAAMHLRRVRVVGRSFSAALMHDQSCYAAKLELELIKIQMAQKPMLRGEVKALRELRCGWARDAPDGWAGRGRVQKPKALGYDLN